MKINTKNMKWTRAPKQYMITEDKIEIITEPHTDLWQRTYYHFRNDNAPILLKGKAFCNTTTNYNLP